MRVLGLLGPIHDSVLGPLGVVAHPVPVGGEVDPHPVPHEAHHAPVGRPRDPRLEVVHDAQRLGRALEVVGAEVGDPDGALGDSLYDSLYDSLVTAYLGDLAAPHVLHRDHGPAVDVLQEALVILLLLEDGEVHDGEGDELVVEHDVLQVLLIKQAVADPDLAECLCPENRVKYLAKEWQETRVLWRQSANEFHLLSSST